MSDRRAPAPRAARVGLMAAAGRAADAVPGSVEQWDARTSANDWRAALSLTLGADPDEIHPARGTIESPR